MDSGTTNQTRNVSESQAVKSAVAEAGARKHLGGLLGSLVKDLALSPPQKLQRTETQDVCLQFTGLWLGGITEHLQMGCAPEEDTNLGSVLYLPLQVSCHPKSQFLNG